MWSTDGCFVSQSFVYCNLYSRPNLRASRASKHGHTIPKTAFSGGVSQPTSPDANAELQDCIAIVGHGKIFDHNSINSIKTELCISAISTIVFSYVQIGLIATLRCCSKTSCRVFHQLLRPRVLLPMTHTGRARTHSDQQPRCHCDHDVIGRIHEPGGWGVTDGLYEQTQKQRVEISRDIAYWRKKLQMQ